MSPDMKMPTVMLLRGRVSGVARSGADGLGGHIYNLIWQDALQGITAGVQLAYDTLIENGITGDSPSAQILAQLMVVLEDERRQWGRP